MDSIDTLQIYTIMVSFIIGILTGGVSFCLVFGLIERFRLPRFNFKKREKKERDSEGGSRRIAFPGTKRRSSYFDQDDVEEEEDLRSPDEIRRILGRQDRSNKYFIKDSQDRAASGDDQAPDAITVNKSAYPDFEEWADNADYEVYDKAREGGNI